jgi:uncharacterized protein YggE
MKIKRLISMMNVIVLSILFISACRFAPAVNSPGGESEVQNTVQVVGIGEAKGTSDIASIQLGVSLVDTNLKSVIETANQTIERITSALIDAGVNTNDIQTSNYGIWPEEVYDRSTGEPTGERKYHSDVTLTVTIREIDRMVEFIQTGLDAGVNNMYGISFGLDERSALESAARTEAISDARSRAEELAAGLGLQVGEPLSISEGVVGSGTTAERYEGLGIGGGAPISPGQSTVTVEVVVLYELVE